MAAGEARPIHDAFGMNGSRPAHPAAFGRPALLQEQGGSVQRADQPAFAQVSSWSLK
jgi:hypothetical protein